METSNLPRVFTAAKEFNIGVETLKKCLNENGFRFIHLSEKNFILTDAMYEVLKAKFGNFLRKGQLNKAKVDPSKLTCDEFDQIRMKHITPDQEKKLAKRKIITPNQAKKLAKKKRKELEEKEREKRSIEAKRKTYLPPTNPKNYVTGTFKPRIGMSTDIPGRGMYKIITTAMGCKR